MARISGSRGRSFSGGGHRASSFRSSGIRSGSSFRSSNHSGIRSSHSSGSFRSGGGSVFGSPSRGESHMHSGTQSSLMNSRHHASGFKPTVTKQVGNYTYRDRPYRKDYYYHSLDTPGRVIYVIITIIFLLFLIFVG